MAEANETYLHPLTAAVGQSELNRKHDVALVQAALKLIKDKHGKPYLHGTIDGVASGGTFGAIGRFQADNGGDVIAGTLAPRSSTFDALKANLPAGTRLATIPDHKIVYRAATDNDLAEAQLQVAFETKFNPAFREALRQLNAAFYAADRLVLAIAPKGGYRTFQEQYVESNDPHRSKAGPGESNHNWGNGCDFGFYQFAFLSEHGVWHNESPWLSNRLMPKNAPGTLGLPFWKRRNSFFANRGLYPSKLKGDFVHVQAFNDDIISMPSSLADLMSREADNCYWSAQGQHYRATLVFQDEQQYRVGTARQIWNLEAPIAHADLAAVLEAGRQLRNDVGFESDLETCYASFAGPHRDSAKPWKAADITHKHVQTMRRLLRDDFEAAEAARQKWRAKS